MKNSYRDYDPEVELPRLKKTGNKVRRKKNDHQLLRAVENEDWDDLYDEIESTDSW
jgi:hypothetical protein